MTEGFKFMEFSEMEESGVIYNTTLQNTKKNTKWSVNTWDAPIYPTPIVNHLQNVHEDRKVLC
jgi:hypothetical protein